MRAEFVNPFVQATCDVVRLTMGTEPKLGSLSARPKIFTATEFNVSCGIVGDLVGGVLYGLSSETAYSVAKQMLGGMEEIPDELSTSALAELGNMISGNTSSKLQALGFVCDITPPSIIRGTNISISTIDIPALVIPIELGAHGSLEITVSLKERAAVKAA